MPSGHTRKRFRSLPLTANSGTAGDGTKIMNTPTNTEAAVAQQRLVQRLRRFHAQLAPHQKSREAGSLILEAAEEIELQSAACPTSSDIDRKYMILSTKSLLMLAGDYTKTLDIQGRDIPIIEGFSQLAFLLRKQVAAMENEIGELPAKPKNVTSINPNALK